MPTRPESEIESRRADDLERERRRRRLSGDEGEIRRAARHAMRHNKALGAAALAVLYPPFARRTVGRVVYFVLMLPAATAAVLLSFLAHSVLLLVLAFIFLDQPAGSAGGAGEIELAIVTQTELTQLQSAALDATLPEIADASSPELVDAALLDTPVADIGMEAAVQDVASLGGAGQGLEEGMDLGGGAGGGAASFFGVEARGSRFAYIVDISGSMTGGKLDTMRRELSGSVEALNEHASFAVVLFSHQAHVIGGRNQWSRAVRRAKDMAVRDINAIAAGGATQPLAAFEIVFGLRPRPDAVYFMTDGMFAESVVQEVARLNSSWIEPTPIHTISFVSREAEAPLRRIAEKSGGVYTHVPGPGQ